MDKFLLIANRVVWSVVVIIFLCEALGYFNSGAEVIPAKVYYSCVVVIIILAIINCINLFSIIDLEKELKEAGKALNTRYELACHTIQHGDINDSIICESCDKCDYGWHRSVNDKPYSFCPNCRANVIGGSND